MDYLAAFQWSRRHKLLHFVLAKGLHLCSLMKMQESGLMKWWKAMHWPNDLATLCTDQSGIPPAVSLEQMSVLFTTLAVLLAVCFGVLCLEIVVSPILERIVPMADDVWSSIKVPSTFAHGKRGDTQGSF